MAGVSRRLISQSAYSNFITDDVTEMPRSFSMAIQSLKHFGSFASLDGSSHLNSSAEKQEFLRECRFPRVRMTDDAESAATFDSFCKCLFKITSLLNKKAD